MSCIPRLGKVLSGNRTLTGREQDHPPDSHNLEQSAISRSDRVEMRVNHPAMSALLVAGSLLLMPLGSFAHCQNGGPERSYTGEQGRYTNAYGNATGSPYTPAYTPDPNRNASRSGNPGAQPMPAQWPVQSASTFPNTQSEVRSLSGSRQLTVLQVLNALNEFRQANGRSALRLDRQLNAAAQAHSDDMASRRVMSHSGANGSQPADRVTAAGYDWSRVAENVAAGQRSAAEVVKAWANSPGHRANMLSDVTDVGIGVNSNYWTMNLARR